MIDRKIVELQQKKQNSGEMIERTALVVFYARQVSERQLWRLRIRAGPSATRDHDIAIAGGEGNSTRFFGSYYEPNLPTHRLLPLGSHIVLMGHRIDSLIVQGLDIAVSISQPSTGRDSTFLMKSRRRRSVKDQASGTT
jgi:hypothetical protein